LRKTLFYPLPAFSTAVTLFLFLVILLFALKQGGKIEFGENMIKLNIIKNKCSFQTSTQKLAKALSSAIPFSSVVWPCFSHFVQLALVFGRPSFWSMMIDKGEKNCCFPIHANFRFHNF